MRQRAMIAMSLACSPELLIADEPMTALDVTIQAQILELLNKLQEERGTAIIMITHDLGVVAETCDDVVVMYAGKVAEKQCLSSSKILHIPTPLPYSSRFPIWLLTETPLHHPGWCLQPMTFRRAVGLEIVANLQAKPVCKSLPSRRLRLTTLRVITGEKHRPPIKEVRNEHTTVTGQKPQKVFPHLSRALSKDCRQCQSG